MAGEGAPPASAEKVRLPAIGDAGVAGGMERPSSRRKARASAARISVPDGSGTDTVPAAEGGPNPGAGRNVTETTPSGPLFPRVSSVRNRTPAPPVTSRTTGRASANGAVAAVKRPCPAVPTRSELPGPARTTRASTPFGSPSASGCHAPACLRATPEVPAAAQRAPARSSEKIEADVRPAESFRQRRPSRR